MIWVSIGAVFLLPPVIALIAVFRPVKDAGPPPPSGHGWITRKD